MSTLAATPTIILNHAPTPTPALHGMIPPATVPSSQPKSNFLSRL